MLDNRSVVVLRSLEKHLLADPKTESPARTAHRYLEDRRDQLDYAGARKQNLPIGSGEIESGHRHVIQHRLKIAGGLVDRTQHGSHAPTPRRTRQLLVVCLLGKTRN